MEYSLCQLLVVWLWASYSSSLVHFFTHSFIQIFTEPYYMPSTRLPSKWNAVTTFKEHTASGRQPLITQQGYHYVKGRLGCDGRTEQAICSIPGEMLKTPKKEIPNWFPEGWTVARQVGCIASQVTEQEGSAFHTRSMRLGKAYRQEGRGLLITERISLPLGQKV